MTPGMLRLVLHSGMALCALMAVLNSLRFRRRGASAFALSAAFLALGFSAYLLSISASTAWLYTGVGLTVLFLIVDFALRAPRPPRQDSKR